MRVLIIDDEPDSILPLKQELDDAHHRWWEVDFGGVQEALENFTPDLVVLDLQLQQVQAATGEAGKTVYEDIIWPTHFCPVVVYSGFADQFIVNHSALVKKVTKGGGSEKLVRDAIGELAPYSESIALLRQDIDAVARTTLRELMLAIAEADDLQEDDKQSLAVAMGRRRAAAYLDDPQVETQHMPESQYVYPVTGNAYRFADILRASGSPADAPTSYRIVLSPSCDLESHGGGAPKVERVLVAKCVSVPFGTRNLPAAPLNQKGKDKLEDCLQAGSHNGLLFLPKFLACVPAMCADFKDLDVIATYAIKPGGECKVDGYERVVSVDSPFRERIAWAFMNTAARPGVPQVDLQRWIAMYQ